MKEGLIVGFSCLLFSILVYVHVQDKKQGVWINCGLSEISPDFTSEMREACRQARSQYASGINK